MRETVRKFKETVEIQASILNRIRSHRLFPAAILVTLVLAACCVYVWQRVRVLELVREVSILKAENASLSDDAAKLNAEIAALSAAGRIELYARDSLGLRPVSTDRLYTLLRKDGGGEVPDDLSTLLDAIEHVTAYVPVVTENEATAGELNPTRLDKEKNGRRDK